MLPIGVVVPTRNSAPYLAKHLAGMRAWLEAVEEIVVVDSFSTDGTLERLGAELRHRKLRILQHPPGLYQSWNHAIQQVQAEYCYISTVGDSITLEGLAHLAEVMQRLRCEVVISRPRFIDVKDRPIKSPGWPVEDLVASLRVVEPIALEGAALLFFTLLHYPNAILGSSASNLYRTGCLQQNPFPVDYGTAGDGGWGLEHCLEIRLGLTPRVFSTFREHPKSYSRAEYAAEQLTRKMFARVCQTFREESARNPAFAELAGRLRVEEAMALLGRQAACQEQLEACREGPWPWVLNPAAWRSRRQRNVLRRALARLKKASVASLTPAVRKAPL
jgi:Glycosyl transferase family 2